MPRPRLALGSLLVVALALPALAPPTSADHPNGVSCLVPDVLCPDIVVDGTRFEPYLETRTFSVWSCDVVEGHTEAGTRKLLRFTFTTPNVGDADLVVGAPQGNPNFEFSDCHGHYHFKEYADYRLWTPEQFAQWDALRAANPAVQAHEVLDANPQLQPIRGEKRGFCVIDIVAYDATPPKWLSCSTQGISVGWADEYYATISGQWVDVTEVPSGEYVLEAEVNAEHLYEESNYDNNRAWQTVTL